MTNEKQDAGKTVEQEKDLYTLPPNTPTQSDPTTPLPWEAPARFRNVPSHIGRLCSPNPVGWKVKNDAQAVAVWMAEKASSNPNTAQAYRKEVERFIFWLADQDMTISEATREDYLFYSRFLLDPQPREKWVSDKRYKRDDPNWRPFQKGLTPAGAKQSLAIIKSLITYLCNTGWLIANTMPDPKNLVATEKKERADEISERQIPPHLMDKLEVFCTTWAAKDLDDEEDDTTSIEDLEDSDQRVRQTLREFNKETFKKRQVIVKARLELIIALAGTLGARTSDLTNGHLNEFKPAPSDAGVEWVWRIPSGKGRKSAALPVPESIMRKMANLRIQLGLTAYPEPNEAPYPLVPDTRTTPLHGKPDPERLRAISRSGLYRHIKQVFDDFSDQLSMEGDAAGAALMKDASLHWLRHTAIKRVLTKTKNLTLAQKLGRHANINTTADYAKATLAELAESFGEDGAKDKK